MLRAGRDLGGRAHAPLLALLVALSVVASACGDSTESVPVVPEPALDAEVYGGFPVDPPGPDEVVLTLEGATRVELTMPDLERLAVVEVTLEEPFVRRRETFRAIPVAVLLDLAGIEEEETVATIALNDYRYIDGAGQLLAAQALVAVARNDDPIPMDAGGPIRLVFADDSDYADKLDAWNWSLRTISRTDPP